VTCVKISTINYDYPGLLLGILIKSTAIVSAIAVLSVQAYYFHA